MILIVIFIFVFLNKTITNLTKKNAFALLVSQAIRSQYCL